MKKKLLLIVAVMALFACLLAVYVSAENIIANTITSQTYGTVYQLSQDPGLDNAHLYVSTLNNIEDKGTDTESMAIITDGTYYYVFPSSYLVDEMTNGKLSFTVTKGAGNNFSSSQKGINDALGEWASAEGITFPTFESSGTWGNTRLNFLVRLQLPTDVTYIDKNHCQIRSDALVEVRFIQSVSLYNTSGVFYGNRSLTTVVGLEKCTSVKTASALFSGCTSLVSVKLPEDVTAIPNEMFYGCTAFTGVENWDSIKNGITSVGNHAFYNCDSLVSISLPSVSTVGKQALAYCAELTTVDFTGAPLVTLNASLRDCPKLNGVVLPDTLTAIAQDGFHNCTSLTSINIPRDCVSIGAYAFNNCSSLSKLDMSKAENLKSTGGNALNGTALTELDFPEGFESFGGIVSSTLTSIEFPNSTTSVGLIKAPITEFVFPLGDTTMGSKQFDYCSSLTTVTIHKGVTSIDLSNEGAFYGSTKNNLKTVIYTGSESDAIVEQIKTALPNATIIYADQCETYFGAHAWSGNATMQAVDYFKDITFADNCTREWCNVCDIDDTKTIGAIFTDLGYAATEEAINGVYSVSQFYEVNKDNLAKYKTATGNTVKYGLVASVNAAPSVDASSAGTFVTEHSMLASNYFEIKIVGLTDANCTKALTFCAYVVDNGAVYYLDGGETVTSVTQKSHADILALKNNSN